MAIRADRHAEIQPLLGVRWRAGATAIRIPVPLNIRWAAGLRRLAAAAAARRAPGLGRERRKLLSG